LAIGVKSEELTMKFKIIDIQEDKNLNCYSVLTVVSISDFIKFVKPIHEDKGNFDDQREVLQTRSAKIIRNQMIEDLREGGILPPIVLGSICDQEINEDNFERLIENKEGISILDGMQRIQALKDAIENRKINHNLRVEFWFANNESALLYRMLILNSGQIPWGIDKQLEVVFKPILQKMEHDIPHLENLISQNLYTKAEIVELFLAFTSRKVRIDKKQQLAEYHSALDIMSLIREKSLDIIERFEVIFRFMIEIYRLFSGIEDRYIFNNQTVRVGFIVACSEKIFGLLGNGVEKNYSQVDTNFDNVRSKLNQFESQIQLQNNRQDIDKFLALDILKEQLRFIPKEKHRQAFLDAFKVIFNESEIHSLAVCWNKMY
jgi:hypothetical protein